MQLLYKLIKKVSDVIRCFRVQDVQVSGVKMQWASGVKDL